MEKESKRWLVNAFQALALVTKEVAQEEREQGNIDKAQKLMVQSNIAKLNTDEFKKKEAK